jgi:hypothetical protein
MAIREEMFKLIDDTKTFTPEQLSNLWEWLDSYDSQPLRKREDATLDLIALSAKLDTYTHRDRVYSVAKCSDGRELIGSVIATTKSSQKVA